MSASKATSSPTSPIDIALGFDEAYAPHASALIASVVRSAPDEHFRFMVFSSGINPTLRKQMEAPAPGQQFLYIDVRDDEIPEFTGGHSLAHINKSTYLRLNIEQMAPADCHRIIYLDSDMTVVGNLAELWTTDLQGCAIGAIPDDYIDAATFAKEWRLDETGARYFNAGVLLIDVDQIRADKSFSEALDFARNNKAAYADQDALNFVFWNKWLLLSTRWNTQRRTAMAIATKAASEHPLPTPAIVHFTGAEKPWAPTGYHPWMWIYWQSLRHTPFVMNVIRTNRISPARLAMLWLRWRLRKWTATPA